MTSAAWPNSLWTSAIMMSWAGIAVRVAGLALLLPLILTHLPLEEILVWQMFAGISLMVSYFDFGFSPTIARTIALAHGGEVAAGLEAPAAIADLVGAQRAIYPVLICAAALIGGAAGTAALIAPMGNLASPIEGWAAWAITAAAALLALSNTGHASIVTGHDRIAELRRIEIFVSVGQLLSTSLAVIAGGDLLAITACYSAWTVLLHALVGRLAKRVAQARPRRGGFDRRQFDALWPQAWRSGVGTMMSNGIIQGSALIYAQLASPSAAASYLLALRLMNVVIPLAQAPFYTRLPALAMLKARNQVDALAALAIRSMRLAFWSYAVGALAVVVFGPVLLEAIGSPVKLPAFGTMALLVAAFFAERYSAMHIQLYSLTNRIVWHIANGITGAAMGLLGLALWPIAGPNALPLAMLYAYAGFCAPYASRLSLRSIGAKQAGFERLTSAGPTAALAGGLLAASRIW